MTFGFAAIGLYQPKDIHNLGGVLRGAHCYGAKLVAYTGRRYKQDPQDTSKAYKHIPLIQTDDIFAVIPHDCVPVAVDLIEGAISLIEYQHPRSAMYIFGPEDGTLGRNVTSQCQDVVQIPTAYCMNLAAAVNVVLYDRMAKRTKSTTVAD